MKKNTITAIATLGLAFMILTGCQHEPAFKSLSLNLPAQTLTYNDSKYLSIAQIGGDNSPISNKMSDAGATLGRVLFYDPRLSVNNTIACASCHKQQYGFADNQALSTGFQGQSTKRNTPAIINAANKSVFFWDGRVNSLETQTLLPVQNHIEMGLESASMLPEKLKSISYYPGLFANAFGSTEITSAKISMAMAQFVRSITSSSPDFSSLSPDAVAGRQLFFGKYECGRCHTGANMGGAPLPVCGGYISANNSSTSAVPNSSNIGLDVNYSDQGIQALVSDPTQNGYFIIPSLRNIGLTAPYMHDGRFATLSDVIDHYSNGIQAHPNLDPLLLSANWGRSIVSATSGTPVKMNISATEKQQLIAFLNSMTDYSITTDPRFSNPFK
jgi:cytochrome c peroxidase